MSGWWVAGLGFVALLVGWSVAHDRGLRALARSRAGWTVDAFVEHFRARGASPELARDVWTALQGVLGPRVPLLPSDPLWAAAAERARLDLHVVAGRLGLGPRLGAGLGRLVHAAQSTG